MDNDEIISKFSSMRQEIAGLIGQVNDLEQERTEHS